MTSKFKLDGFAALVGLCLAFLSVPALAVIEQRVEFPDAKDIQGATLSLEGSDEIITAEVQEESGRKIVIFVLPDGSEGRSATVNVVVDNVSGSYPIVIGTKMPVIRTARSQSVAATPDSGWYFGAGIGAGQLSSDFASIIAQQSAADAQVFLAGQGVANIVPAFNADDDAFAWGGIIEAGYWFPDDSRLSLDFRTGSVDDFGMNVDVSGNIPMSTSIVAAQSVATAELDIWSVNVNYSRFFTPTSNFGFLISIGNQSVERPTSFTSTLSVDGMPVESMTGSETLDENVFQYGVGLEWTQRQAPNWMPTIGIRYAQTADLDIFDKEQLRRIEAYFTVKRRPNRRRIR